MTWRRRGPSLEARGVQFEGDTFDTGVCHMAFFRDPDGNALMLHHRYAPRQRPRASVATAAVASHHKRSYQYVKILVLDF